MKLELRHKILILIALVAAGMYFSMADLSWLGFGFQPARDGQPAIIEAPPDAGSLEKIPTH